MSKRLNIGSVTALVGIVGPVVVVVGDLAASLSTPGYSLVRNSVSSLALTPIGWLQSICLLAMGLLFSFSSVWWALPITALALAGYFLLPGIFYLWMAILGGGGMIALGLYIRFRW